MKGNFNLALIQDSNFVPFWYIISIPMQIAQGSILCYHYCIS